MMNQSKGERLIILGVMLALLAMLIVVKTPPSSAAGTFVVSNTNDSGAGSLRQAIMDANAAGGGTIDATGVNGTIDLVSVLPDLVSNLTITGPGPAKLTVERITGPGLPDFQIFTIFNGNTVSISGMTIKNGVGSGGGGIVNLGTATVSNAIITNGSTLFSGGGIFNGGGTLTVIDSTIANNSAERGGGGIYNESGTLIVRNSTVVNNSAIRSFGAGIFNGATLTVSNSTFAGNSSSIVGGGIYGGGMMTINNSTFAGNSALTGGGIYNVAGTLTVNNSTLANNASTNNGGGGIVNDNGVLNLQSTIVAKNTGGNPDVSGSIISLGHNLIGNTTGSSGSDPSKGDLINIDPMFQLDGMSKPLLANNGGPTQTIALLPGSPAIDHGKNPLGLTTDQRGPGFLRTFDDPAVNNGTGDGTDIGAFEVQPLFDLCLRDESSSAVLQINSQTGDYRFCCGGQSFTGRGTVSIKGSIVNLMDFGGNRRLQATIDRASKRATASLQTGGITCMIMDRDITNNLCVCVTS